MYFLYYYFVLFNLIMLNNYFNKTIVKCMYFIYYKHDYYFSKDNIYIYNIHYNFILFY